MWRWEKPTRAVTFRRGAWVTTLLLAGVILGGCHHSLSGKYTSSEGVGAMSVEFKSGNKAYLNVMGTTLETDYDVNDDKVTFHNVNGSNLVMTIEKDGSLSGPMGMTLKKED